MREKGTGLIAPDLLEGEDPETEVCEGTVRSETDKTNRRGVGDRLSTLSYLFDTCVTVGSIQKTTTVMFEAEQHHEH